MLIRWLHISDLHLGNQEMSSCLMREELPKFIQKNGWKFDYVFLTGDIRTAYIQPNDYTDDMKQFIISVCRVSQVPKDRLFIVPGNHDVNRDFTDRDNAIRRVSYHNSGSYKAAIGTISRTDMIPIIHGEDDFISFIQELLDESICGRYGNPDAPHFVVETADFNILHLDTTIGYTAGQEAHDLIVGTKFVLNALKSLNPEKPTILLTHYPFTSIRQDERGELSSLLQKYNVRLWLAGHEHEQNLQRMKYMDSLQAGEIAYGENVMASFLTGEFNTDTHKCTIRAYAWFREGWAQYPFIDLDNERHDIYECALAPQNRLSVIPAYVVKIRKHNEQSLRRLPHNLNTAIFPRIRHNSDSVSLDQLLDDAWEHEGNANVILLADGGMGKTTMLLHLCKCGEVPTLYISAESLASMKIGLEESCRDSIFDGDHKSYTELLRNRYNSPTMRIVVDGLNEVDAVHEREFVSDIQRMSRLGGLQFVIASRNDFSIRYSMPEFAIARLDLLDENVLESIFSKKSWESIKSNGNLRRLISNPMMLTIYQEISSVIEEFRSIEFLDWHLPVLTASDLFHDYYMAQIALMMKRGIPDGERILLAALCLRYLLPEIAYAYESSFCMNKSNGDFRKIVSDIEKNFTDNPDDFSAIREYFRVTATICLHPGVISDLLIEELHLLYRDNKTTFFPHQMFRDYLSAIWIINKSSHSAFIESLWNRRAIPIPIQQHIRNLSGCYWNGIAEKVRAVGADRNDADVLIQNLIDCFPSDQKGGVANYSHLDFSRLALPDNRVFARKVDLSGAVISDVSVGITASRAKKYTGLCFSPDCSMLGAIEGTNVHIFDVRTSQNHFVYNLGKKCSGLIFCGNRMLALAGRIFVFTNENGWRYVGEIMGVNNVASGLKAATIAGDDLRLYYKKRHEVYSLVNCKFKQIVSVPATIDDISAGENITALFKQKASTVEDALAVCYAHDYKAASYDSGRLIISCENDILYILDRGVDVLADAAISGDGCIAATLSYGSFKNRRRVIVWNLHDNIVVGEIECPSDIHHISLSEDGSWIIGQANVYSWIYNRNTGEQKTYSARFKSNQQNKFITFKNAVLTAADGLGLRLYDLDTGTEKRLSCSFHDPGLVSFLPNGNIAAVNASGCTLRFASIWNDSRLEMHPDSGKYTFVQPFKNQPFIAVASTDRRISIYHTGTGQRTRKLDSNNNIDMVITHPDLTLLAHTNGLNSIDIEYFKEEQWGAKQVGWWKHYSYSGKLIETKILDMAFNAATHSLIAITAKGQILFFHEIYGDHKYSAQIINSLHLDAYDFHGVECSVELKAILRQNGSNCD